MMLRALMISEKQDSAHPHIAIELSNLAVLLHRTNRSLQAEQLMDRALAIDEAHYRSTHPMVAIRLNNLAMLLHETNRSSKAEPLLRRALAIVRQTLWAEHPTAQTVLENYLAVLESLGKSPAEIRALIAPPVS